MIYDLFKKYKHNIHGFIFALIFIILLLGMLQLKNSNHQSIATIDYVYATIIGEDPSKSDTWLAEQYCLNKIGLMVGYPEMKDKCDVILDRTTR